MSRGERRISVEYQTTLESNLILHFLVKILWKMSLKEIIFLVITSMTFSKDNSNVMHNKIFQHNVCRILPNRCLYKQKISFLIQKWDHCKTMKTQNRKNRSSRPEVFCEKGFFRNFAKFTGKHLCQNLFFNKVPPASLLKKRLWHRHFPVNFTNTSGGCFW